MMNGKTTLIGHIGYPTESFKSPMIYNPWFDKQGINAQVVTMGVKPEDFRATFPALCKLTNLRGFLVTMPHKVVVMDLVDEVTPTARIAGAANAVLVRPDGTLLGDQFDGAGFVRGVQRKGFVVKGAKVLVSGCGGVGSAIAASLAAEGPAELAVFDMRAESAEGLAQRLAQYYPDIRLSTGSNDPAGYDLVVNATPMGMNADDPLPFDVSRIAPSTFVGEVVMKTEITPLLAAVQAKGCRTQVGTDMLFEMIPAYLEFFGFGTATPDDLRASAQIAY
ncbi:shikimate dehydrogenase [Aquabacterium sp.]|jgi:shikimate dehydrogenase|uniref:shikimate dehydrogenase family protein n=1 Tax=Aquabacterium sp. TaxID=1872578 RepID=UPI0025BEA5C5|nr:shikimate dehydrogenase [Aquabacterium sp.]